MRKKKMKIRIHTYSAELPDPVDIELTLEQWKALWVALELPHQKALNADDLMRLYSIDLKPNRNK
jgi:hypothetical protein